MHAVDIGVSTLIGAKKLIIKPRKSSFKDTQEKRTWVVGGGKGNGLILTCQKGEGSDQWILRDGILSLGYSEAESHKALLLLCVSITQ